MDFGKLLIVLGFFIIVIGAIFLLGGKLGIPFGHLPGDIRVKGEKTSFYFPIVTSILISVFLTILLNVIFYFFRK